MFCLDPSPPSDGETIPSSVGHLALRAPSPAAQLLHSARVADALRAAPSAARTPLDRRRVAAVDPCRIVDSSVPLPSLGGGALPGARAACGVLPQNDSPATLSTILPTESPCVADDDVTVSNKDRARTFRGLQGKSTVESIDVSAEILPLHKRVRTHTMVSTSHLSQISALSSRRGSIGGENAPIDTDTTLFAFAAVRERPVVLGGSRLPADGGLSPVATTDSPGCVPPQLPARQYLALHLCLFLHEGSAEPQMVRWPPSRRYAEWLMRMMPWIVTQPLSQMQWTGLGVPRTIASSSSASTLAPIPGPMRASSESASVETERGGVGAPPVEIVWRDWLPFHSACAAGVLDVAQRFAAADRNALSAPALRWTSSSASPSPRTLPPQLQLQQAQTALVHPVRVAVEASFWTERVDVVGWLTQMLSPTQLDVQVYGPCRYLSTTKPDFAKLLCKSTPLSLRALRLGSASSSSGLGGGASRRGGRRISGTRALVESVLASQEGTESRSRNPSSHSALSQLNSGSASAGAGHADDPRPDLSDTHAVDAPGVGKLGRRTRGDRSHLDSTSSPLTGHGDVTLKTGRLSIHVTTSGQTSSQGSPEAITRRGVRTKPNRVVRFRRRSESPRSPRMQNPLPVQVDEGTSRADRSASMAVAQLASSVVDAATGITSQVEGISRSESHGSLHSVSRRTRAVSVDAGNGCALGACSAHTRQQTPLRHSGTALRDGDSLDSAPFEQPSLLLSHSSTAATGEGGTGDFESVASRKARRRAAAAAASSSSQRTSVDGSLASGSNIAVGTLVGQRAPPSRSPLIQSPQRSRVARQQDSPVAPPVAAPTYALSLTGLGETILPAQFTAFDSGDTSRARLGFGDESLRAGAAAIRETGHGSHVQVGHNQNSKRHLNQLGLLSELDTWLGRSPAISSPEIHPSVPVDTVAMMLPTAQQEVARGRAVRQQAIPVNEETAQCSTGQGALPRHEQVASFDGTTGVTAQDAKMTSLPPVVCLESLVGFGSVGTAVYVGKYGRLRATIKRFETRLHQIQSFLTGLAAFHDITGVHITHDAVRSGLVHIQRFLGDAESDTFTFVAFERCDSTVTAAMGKSDSSITRGLAWCQELVAGVAALHAVGMVHGSLHSGNVLLRGSSVRIADAGLSQSLVSGSLTLVNDDIDSVEGRGAAVILELSLRHCLHPLAAPEVHATVNRLLREPRDQKWTAKIASCMPSIFSAAADSFSLGHFIGAIALPVHGESGTTTHTFPPVTLRSGARGRLALETHEKRDLALLDLAHRFSHALPEARLSAAAALQHPAFLSPQGRVDSIVAFSAAMLSKYGHPSSSVAPELAYLERAFVFHEGHAPTLSGTDSAGRDWVHRLESERRIVWPTSTTLSPSSSDLDFSRPRQYMERYSALGQPCLGEYW